MQEAEFRYCLERILDEEAFFRLVEAGREILPWLQDQFRIEKCAERRAAIVRVVWERRKPESVGFLASALADPSDLVWKQALDGLVAIGGTSALEAMRNALAKASRVKQDWINEAIGQAGEQKTG